jgi:hypothetical protein
MILVEIHDGLFHEHFRIRPTGTENGWRVLTECDAQPALPLSLEALACVCPLLREAGELSGQNHFEDFDALKDEILKRAPGGRAWNEVFDDKSLHDIGEVVITRKSGKVERHKLFQFQKRNTLVRVAWAYGNGRKTMLITHMFVKPGGKKTTPQNEKDRAQKVLQKYCDAVDTSLVKLIDEQGGRDGFLKLAP